ncbi:hypothetical protein T10_5504 [Trichinella papuae]|uniref:Uncharacterized protein n=1 Tax=Trichinella papuae TaxID=268474 RepID=A0A0V1M055_9BILA|nr:hypothetical protein T10_7792 [Trichinella papuae]KRZ66088.1 hypothetical protein T10_5504 [Trichinella papuae]
MADVARLYERENCCDAASLIYEGNAYNNYISNSSYLVQAPFSKKTLESRLLKLEKSNIKS